MKGKILSLALAVLLAAAPAAVPAGAAAFTPVTGADMLKNILLGINIGNTLEANPFNPDTGEYWMEPHGLETEVCWGSAKIEPWQFKAIVQKGYTAVRIPVSWEPHMDADYKIDKAWMDRVRQCVDWALAEGLYVIINAHHEWERFYEFVMEYDREGAKEELTAIWAQVAEVFKDYPERLIFEPMNEPHRREGWIWDSWGSDGGHVDRKLCDIVNQLNADALETIRQSGGFNDRRVVLQCVPGANCEAIEFYQPPDDPYTMLGVFVYPGGDSFDAAKKQADKELAEIKKGVDRGVPILIKETSLWGTFDGAQQVEWVRQVHDGLAGMGVPSFWWNCNGSDDPSLLFDRATGEWPHKPLLDAVFAAYGKTPGSDFEYTPPPPAFPYELTGTFNDQEYNTWADIPLKERNAAEKLVIETSGAIGFLKVALADPFTEYEKGRHERITEEPGKIIFDLRGLEGWRTIGVLTWGDAAKVKRLYLDTWEGVPSLANFTKVQTYDNNFTDIDSHYSMDWIIKAYDYGIIAGSGNTYGTTSNMTVQDALVIASKMHGIYNTGDYDYNSHGAYPGGFISYALENGIIDNRFDGRYAQDATRGELAYIWGNILPKEELQKLNDYAPFSDVPEGHTYYDEIKLFFEAGIVTGSEGRFNPDSSVIRGDCAVMFVRLVSVTDRSEIPPSPTAGNSTG